MKIGLVACCGKKLDYPAPAGKIYISPLFKKAASYCEEKYDIWFILSAKHKLLHPDTLISPYNIKLPDDKDRLNEWAINVFTQLKPYISPNNIFVLHAGIKYRTICEFLPIYEIPLLGLGIGQQLAWYNKNLY